MHGGFAREKLCDFYLVCNYPGVVISAALVSRLGGYRLRTQPALALVVAG